MLRVRLKITYHFSRPDLGRIWEEVKAQNHNNSKPILRILRFRILSNTRSPPDGYQKKRVCSHLSGFFADKMTWGLF